MGKNGYIWMLDHAVLVRRGRGRPLKVVGIWVDISERKKAEEALRQSEERYRALAESAQDFIFVVDKDGYVQYVNPLLPANSGSGRKKWWESDIHELFPPDRAEHN